MARIRPTEPFIPPAPAEMPEEAKSAKRLRVGMSVAEFAARPPMRKRLYGDEKIKAEMEERASSGEWEGATGAHLVALFDFLHVSVYGIASELDRKTRMFATSSANRMLKDDFKGDASKAVLFMKWVWRREGGREEWRRANNREGGRVGWRLMFCFAGLLTDYRLHCARQGGEE